MCQIPKKICSLILILSYEAISEWKSTTLHVSFFPSPNKSLNKLVFTFATYIILKYNSFGFCVIDKAYTGIRHIELYTLWGHGSKHRPPPLSLPMLRRGKDTYQQHWKCPVQGSSLAQDDEGHSSILYNLLMVRGQRWRVVNARLAGGNDKCFMRAGTIRLNSDLLAARAQLKSDTVENPFGQMVSGLL